MSDRILGGLGLALAASYAWAATLIPESFASDAIGPEVFPFVIAIVLALSSLVFIFQPDPEPSWPGLGRLAEIGFAVVVMFAYAQLLETLGFLIATALAAAYLTWRLGSGPLESVVVGVATSVGLYVLFALVFGLSLAEGPLGF